MEDQGNSIKNEAEFMLLLASLVESDFSDTAVCSQNLQTIDNICQEISNCKKEG